MRPAEHDPLQFGGEGLEEQSLDDDAPPSYGAAAEEQQHQTPPPPDPLAPAAQQQSWQHYPAPPAPDADAAAQQAPARYPAVPMPAAPTAASPTASTASGGASPPPPAAARAALAAAGSPPPVGNPALRIAVHNPLKHHGPSAIPGLEESYTSYEVVSVTTLPHFSGGRHAVRRRFKDFVSLSNLLPRLLHGSLLPARPAKNLVEGHWRMTDAFVEARRAALERYLNRLTAHPHASRSEVTHRGGGVAAAATRRRRRPAAAPPPPPEGPAPPAPLAPRAQALRVFLEADGALRSSPEWRALKPSALTPVQATNRLLRTLVGARKTAPSPSEVVQPAAATRDVYRLLHENVAQLRGSFKHVPLSPEEVALRDETVLVTDGAAALHVALHRAEAWARAGTRRAGLLSEAAAALGALSSFEASYAECVQPGVVAGLGVTGQALQAAAKAAGDAAGRGGALLQPLRDHHAASPGLLGTLHARERQLLTVHTLKQDLAARQAQLAAAQLMPASQAKKLDQLRTAVGQLEVSVAAAEAEYRRQLTRNAEELVALRGARGAELAAMVAALVSSELRHEQAAAAVWQALARDLPQPGLVTAYQAQRDLTLPPLA
ncbi:SNX2B [Scenedesmus sp. PABB004]|nr:SNX2B [Scenedesmus sp. PABB004]